MSAMNVISQVVRALRRWYRRGALKLTVAGLVSIAVAVTSAVPAQAASVTRLPRDTRASSSTVNQLPKQNRPDNNHYAGLTSTEKAKLRAAALREAKPSADVSEDISARTQNSSTTVDPTTGTRLTQLSPTPLNFKDEDGKWRPIDTKLVPVESGEGWHNTAAGYDATLPTTLADPLVLRDSADSDTWVSAQLVPATAHGRDRGRVDLLVNDRFPVGVGFRGCSTGGALAG